VGFGVVLSAKEKNMENMNIFKFAIQFNNAMQCNAT
jgi:hypothetical protein